MVSSPPAFLYATSLLLSAVRGGEALAAYYSYEYCHEDNGGDGLCGVTYIEDSYSDEYIAAAA